MKNVLVESTKSKFQVLAQKPANVLKRIKGVLSDFGSNRNGRIYPRELWENVLNSDYVKEMINSHGLVGELDHPEERLEISLQEVSHVINDMWIEGDQEMGIIDILPTPNGKIVNELLDYGTDIGISSRGAGSVGADNVVDPDYQFITFDFVARPSCEAARLNTILEGVKVDLANNSDDKVNSILESYKEELSVKSNLDLDNMADELRKHFKNVHNKDYIDQSLRDHYKEKFISEDEYHTLRKEYGLEEATDLDSYTEDDYTRSSDRYRELEKIKVRSSGLIGSWSGEKSGDKEDTIEYSIEDKNGNVINTLEFNVDNLGKMSDEEYENLKIKIDSDIRSAIANKNIGVSRECPMCGKEYIMYVDPVDYEKYMSGEGFIQDVFPYLNPMEREFIKTGYCPNCQDEIFGSSYKSKNIISIDEARKMLDESISNLNEAMSDQEVYKIVLGWYKDQIEAGKMTLNQCYELLSDKAKVSLNKLVDQSKIRESVMNRQVAKLIKESTQLNEEKNIEYSEADEKKLNEIYNNLQAGITYGEDMDKEHHSWITYPYFDTVLWLMANSPHTAEEVIGWRHYGSSANKNTLEDLKWILDNIFEMTPTEFTSKYITNKESKLLDESYEDEKKYRMDNDDDLIVIKKNGEVIAKGMVDDLKDNWDDFNGFKFDGKKYVDGEYTIEKIIVEAYDEPAGDKKHHPVINNDLEISSPLELNSGVLPVVDVDQYSRGSMFDDFDIESEDLWDDVYKELDRATVEYATPVVEEYIQKVLPSAKVEGTKVYHPKYYNFDTDQLEFKVSFDTKEYNDLEDRAVNDPGFKDYLKKYGSRDGFISYMADNLDEFYQQDGWKRFVQVIMYYLKDEDFDSTNESLWENIFYNSNIWQYTKADEE